MKSNYEGDYFGVFYPFFSFPYNSVGNQSRQTIRLIGTDMIVGSLLVTVFFFLRKSNHTRVYFTFEHVNNDKDYIQDEKRNQGKWFDKISRFMIFNMPLKAIAFIAFCKHSLKFITNTR